MAFRAARTAAGYRISLAPEAVDAAALARDLRAVVAGEVRFDETARSIYSTDASNYRRIPIGVVIPRTIEDVVNAVAVCRRHGAPIVSRGGATSLAGQTCNAAVVIDFSKHLHALKTLDAGGRRAAVEPGIILDTLRDAAAPFDLTLGPDPATHSRCTVGGMIGNNACGVHAQMSGRMAENVASLEILTYDGVRMRVGPTSEAELAEKIRRGGREGEIYAGLKRIRDVYGDLIRARYPDIPRIVSGYSLMYLLPEHGMNVARALVGSEGTCVTVLEAEVELVYSHPGRALMVLGYPDVYEAAAHVPLVLEHEPIALEGLDHRLIGYMKQKPLNVEYLPLLPEGRGFLLVEMGGATDDEAMAKARALESRLGALEDGPAIKVFPPGEDAEHIWAIRESGLGATAFVPGERDTWPGWEDSAVPPDRVAPYLRDLRALFEKHGYDPALYGHFGQGCIHCRVDFDLTSAQGLATYRAFLDEAADLVVSYGGSLSGEHGDGQARGELLPRMFGEELLAAMREFKALWDPEGRMNPGKVVDPDPILSHLRLGADYRPRRVETHFQFPEDGGDFAHAALRCVGVGACRSLEGGTMCPSFQVTREEQHTTRGRARALFEMMRGDFDQAGWKSEPVKQALELCLSCKGCKSDCPVDVDMATYKAEFLSHYYEGRLRPRAAYAMGLINVWARLAALVPNLANAVTQTPGVSHAFKRLGGIVPERPMPAFAAETFKAWFARRTPRNVGAKQVVLWPDTFNNHFHPEVAKAAVEVLEAGGYHVTVPGPAMCCGRPLYDSGMLGLAERYLARVLDVMRPALRAGTPIVGLEPSCVAVFRDELPNLMPHDADAKRLRDQSFMLGEFLAAEGWQPPPLPRKAVVHVHCHHRSVLDSEANRRVMDKLGLDYEVLDSGCCGLAGSFGYEAGEKYELAQMAGERVLLPAVRAAEPDTLVITDGFSCHSQIAQNTGRRPLHLAEVLHMALAGAPAPRSPRRPTRVETALLLGMAALVAWKFSRRRA